MYLTFDQVILVSNRTKIRPDDPAVFVRELNGQRILTTDGGPSRFAGPATKYGRIYYDVSDQPCVVPDHDDDYQRDLGLVKTWV